MPDINNFLLNLPLPLLDHWGYIIIFLSAIAETLPIIGTFIPGQTIIILAGFLAKLGVFKLEAVLLVAAVGAVAGDLLAYYIGRKFGYDFVIRYGKYFFLNEEKYQTTKDLVAEHTGKALIIGRFSPFTRALAAFLAGIYKIKLPKFVFYSISGGVGWSIISVLLGYLMGQGLEGAAKYLGKLVLVAVILIILIILAYRYLDRKKHIFMKNHLIFLSLNAISIYVLSKLAEDYFDKEAIYSFDLWLAENMASVSEPWLNKLMVFITTAFSPQSLLILAMLAAVYYFIKKHWYRGSLVFLSSAGGLALGAGLKLLITRPRPLGGLVSEIGFSFPSQHANLALIFFSLLILLFGEKIKTCWLKYLFMAGNLTLILLVGFSRVYLKVHYLSDVVAGYALGLFWLTLLILLFRIGFKLAGDYPWLQKIIKK